MLNKARELMNQRESMIVEAKAVIKEAQETLVVLGETNETTIVTNETIININKGKIVEVPVVKEVVVENTNEEYIEQLLKDLENRNKRIEELKALLEREQQLYKDLEFEANEEIDAVAEKRDKEIARLKEELASKDLLLDEFREAMDEKVNRIHELEDKIDGMEYVHKGVVAGYEGQLQNKQLTIESLEKQIADAKEDKVRAEIIRRKNGATIEVVDDPLYNKPQEEKKAPKQTVKAKKVDMVLYDVHRTHDGSVRGCTKDYEFAWDGKSNVPAYKTKGMKKWHPMIREMYADALYIKEQVKDMFKETKEVKTTKEVKVNTTKDITIPTQKPNRTTHVSNGATISLPVVEAPEEEDVLGNTDDLEF